MENKIKAIPYTEHLCFNCLKEFDNINTYTIGYRGYGSSFDSTNTKLQLCDECAKRVQDIWFNEQPIMEDDDCYENYKYEKDISDFIKLLPIQGRELFENTCASDACSYPMEAQDWIDYELGILPHEKCKEYGMYSPQERQAYKDRFPTCNRVYKEVYDDGSSGCWCPFGASGDSDGSCGINISDECYLCSNYEIKKDKMKIINVKDEFYKRKKERLEDMITYATKRLEQLNKGELDDEIY